MARTPTILFDPGRLASSFGNDKEQARSLMGEFRTMFQENSQLFLKHLLHSEYGEIARLAHSLKGASSVVGAECLAQAACDLETIAPRGIFPEVEHALAVLRQTFDETWEYCRQNGHV